MWYVDLFTSEACVSLTSMVVQNQVLTVVSHSHGIKIHSHLHAFTDVKGATGGSH